MGDVTRVAKEAIEGHRVIKVFTAEDSQQRRFEEVNEHNRRSNVRLINAKAMQCARWCRWSRRWRWPRCWRWPSMA